MTSAWLSFGLGISAGGNLHIRIWDRRRCDRLCKTQRCPAALAEPLQRRHPHVLDLAGADLHRRAAHADFNWLHSTCHSGRMDGCCRRRRLHQSVGEPTRLKRLTVDEDAIFHPHDPVHHSGKFGIMGRDQHADACAVG